MNIDLEGEAREPVGDRVCDVVWSLFSFSCLPTLIPLRLVIFPKICLDSSGPSPSIVA